MERVTSLAGTTVSLPTEAELDILKIVWGQGRSTVGSVHFDLNERRQRGYTTVLKLMQIMLAKGLLSRIDKERVHIYLPAVSEEEVRRGYVGAVARKLFEGSLFGLTSFALGMTAVDEEVGDMRAVLDARDCPAFGQDS